MLALALKVPVEMVKSAFEAPEGSGTIDITELVAKGALKVPATPDLEPVYPPIIVKLVVLVALIVPPFSMSPEIQVELASMLIVPPE